MRKSVETAFHMGLRAVLIFLFSGHCHNHVNGTSLSSEVETEREHPSRTGQLTQQLC